MLICVYKSPWRAKRFLGFAAPAAVRWYMPDPKVACDGKIQLTTSPRPVTFMCRKYGILPVSVVKYLTLIGVKQRFTPISVRVLCERQIVKSS